MATQSILTASTTVQQPTTPTGSATNRFTFGLGYNVQKWNFDLAYQYSCQKGDFYPFASYIENTATASPEDNIPTSCEVKNNRSQLLLTIGYNF